jgi:hypothetical protein
MFEFKYQKNNIVYNIVLINNIILLNLIDKP